MNLARTQAALMEFCELVKYNYKINIAEVDPRTGYSSYVSGDMSEGFRYDLSVYKNSFNIVFYLEEPDGYYQEFGVNGFMNSYSSPYSYQTGGVIPNVGDIMEWMDAKNIVFTYQPNVWSKWSRAKRNGKPMKPLAAAIVVAKKIKKEGLQPRDFFSRAVEYAFEFLDEEVIKAFALDIDDFLDQLELID